MKAITNKVKGVWRYATVIPVAILALATIVASNGGGGGDGGTTPSAQLTGTVAAGAPISSTAITIKDRQGSKKTATTGANGKYQLDVTGMTAPFLMRVPHGNKYLYSVATEAGTANVHPFTNLIIRNWYKVRGADVATDFEGTGALSKIPLASEIDTIEAVIRGILSAWFTEAGVVSTFNLIESPFDADGTGFDMVLDNTGVQIDEAIDEVTVTTTDPVTNIEGTAVATTISTDLTPTDIESPTIPPTGLAAIAADVNKIVLVWDVATDNIGVAGYNIYRGGSQLATSPYPVYSDTGLASGTYCYQVEAFDGAGNTSAKTAEVCATTLVAADTTPPTAPTGLIATVVVVSTSRIDLSWSSSTDDAGVVGYAIYHNGTLVTSVGATSYSARGLSSGTQYCYTVKAFDAVPNYSIASTQACDTTSPGLPAAPADVTASAGDGQVMVSWSAVTGATSYSLYMASQSGVSKDNYSTLQDGKQQLGIIDTTYTYTSLTSGTTYYFVATAVNAYGESVESTQVSATPTAAVPSKFAIAVDPAVREQSFGAAFDGTNYLVGIQNVGGTGDSLTAQFVSPAGTLGTEVTLGGNGGAPLVAFDGTNYLVVWEEDPDGTNIDHIYGQIISPSGSAVTGPFKINTTDGNLEPSHLDGVVFDGIGYWVGWLDHDNKALYTRRISTSGTFLTDEKIAQGGSAVGEPGGFVGFACDATNCMGAYDTGTEIRAEIIDKAGSTIAKEFVVATKEQGTCTDWNDVGIKFDGTNYLVVWNDHSDCASSPVWDALAQFVDTSGNLVGSSITINATVGATLPNLAFDGSKYLVVWIDTRNDANRNGLCDTGEGTCWDVYGQYLSTSGALIGTAEPLDTNAGNQLGAIHFVGGKYLLLINDLDTFDGTVSDVYGMFITP